MYSRENIDGIFLPLLRKLTKMQKEKDGRVLALLAAPPGAGKSTLLSGRLAISAAFRQQNIHDVKQAASNEQVVELLAFTYRFRDYIYMNSLYFIAETRVNSGTMNSEKANTRNENRGV